MSGSGGTATGKVCIIKSPAEFNKLQPGEILVCTYTDPEWTPLFTLAAGVVVDTGGTLSHAAIVAREYKIPAVLATEDATKKLKDGEFIVVDGTKATFHDLLRVDERDYPEDAVREALLRIKSLSQKLAAVG